MSHPDCSWLATRPIAHRGLHDATQGRVENCLKSFDAAIAQNFSIELDVQVTRDGKIAVFHDYELDRLTHGSGRVDETDMATLAKLDFRDGTDHIIELSELLDIVKGRVPLVVEIKTPKTNDGSFEKTVAAAVKTYDGPLALMSFSPQIVENLLLVTDRPRGIVSYDYLRDENTHGLSHEERYELTHLLHSKSSKPDFISYCQTDLPAPSVDMHKQFFNLPVICWTTKDVESHKRALNYCDQITFEGYNPDLID